MSRLLLVIEAGLYVLFLADCLVLLVSSTRFISYQPDGGISLIVILLVGAGVHRLRVGREF